MTKQPPAKRLFRWSRALHKYAGLVFLVYLAMGAATGIFLNHPEIVDHFDMPAWCIPPQYRLENWNRSALIGAAFSKNDPQTAYFWGWEGVWKTEDGGASFTPMDIGYPRAARPRRTNALLLIEGASPLLLAGTNTGLFACNPGDGHWSRVPLPGPTEPVHALMRSPDRLIALTPEHGFAAPPDTPLAFEPVTLARAGAGSATLSLPHFFFALHHGKVWGLPGRLLFDAAGLIMLFLCFSAFYMWYFPWRTKRVPAKARPKWKGKLWATAYRLHIKAGIWVAVVFLVLGGTAFFMRPPTILLLLDRAYPFSLYPPPLRPKPWHEGIQNAAYVAGRDQLLIQADGFWAGPADFSAPFERIEAPAPVFAMGATVLECGEDDDLMVGSFSGLWRRGRARAEAGFALPEDCYPESMNKPAPFMVTGYFKTPSGAQYVAGHRRGLHQMPNLAAPAHYAMPAEMKARYRMPLWNFLFEIHNGRILKDLIGGFYIIVPHVASLALLLITLTGIYDWFARPHRRSAKRIGKESGIGRQEPE